MTQPTWSAVDQYFNQHLSPSDPALDAALAASTAGGLPEIQVAANQGKLLYMLARIHGARKVLEIGTLGGYSTIWLARGVAEGSAAVSQHGGTQSGKHAGTRGGARIVTLEFDPKHAAVAVANIARAGFAELVDVRVGRAIDTLPGVERDGLGPFDLIFIDADKPSNPEYFAWALKLARVGSVIVVDNVVRDGEVVNTNSDDPRVLGVRRMVEMIEREPRVSATAIQTVGSKGYDGFLVALVVK